MTQITGRQTMTEQTTIAIVIPVWNQIAYTRLCLESLKKSRVAGAEIIVVDNGSTDETSVFLSGQADIRVITNPANAGCAAAWNQGVQAAADAEWILLLNNDVLLPAGWLAGLLSFARERKVDVASPALREGAADYDLDLYAREFVGEMSGVERPDVAHGICFMVHRKVFEAIGRFDENFRIGQFEDTDFFRRAVAAGFRLATTGGSLIHHFGSVTQDSVRTNGPCAYEIENRAYYHKKWNLTWWKRVWFRHRNRMRDRVWRHREFSQHAHTLKERWEKGRLHYD
jgi:GT2 family glycosyltransferase